MNPSNFIKDIGRPFFFSSFLPTALFVSLGFLLYKNFINLDFITYGQKEPFSALPLIILSASIVWVAFALYSTVDSVTLIYEGCFLPDWARKLLVRLFIAPEHRKKTRNIKESNNIRNHLPKQLSQKEKKIISQARSEYFEVETASPLQEEDLLPTRLGNVMRASEIYSRERFGFDGLVFWPRLSTLLPENMRSILEEKNNHLIFLLNSSLLSYINGAIAIVIWAGYHLLQKYRIIYDVLNDWGLQNLFKGGFHPFSANVYGIFGLVWLIAGYFLYRSSISVAETFGLLIRSSFDLYRFDLLKQLNHPVPKSLKQERETWKKLNEFIVNAGKLGGTPLNFKYALRPELKGRVSKSTGD